jgi:hypothetical protein
MFKKLFACVLLFLTFAVSLSAFAVDGSIYTSYVNKYLWRGQVLSNGPALQSGLSFGAQGAAVELWTSSQQMASPDLFDDVDLIASYEHSIPYADFLSLGVGYISYFIAPFNYPFLTPSQEVSVTLKSDIISSPYITFYHSLDAAKTYDYMEGGVSYEYELGELLGGKTAAGASASIGFDLNQVTYDYVAMIKTTSVTPTILGVNLYINYKIAGFTVTPSAFFQLNLDKYNNASGAKLYSNNSAFSILVNYDFTMGEPDKAVKSAE